MQILLFILAIPLIFFFGFWLLLLIGGFIAFFFLAWLIGVPITFNFKDGTKHVYRWNKRIR